MTDKDKTSNRIIINLNKDNELSSIDIDYIESMKYTKLMFILCEAIVMTSDQASESEKESLETAVAVLEAYKETALTPRLKELDK